jgi:hypothetical protein
LKKLVNKEYPINLSSPQHGEFMNSKIMAWWYLLLQLVSRGIDYVRNQFTYFLYPVKQWNDTIFETTDGK